MSFQITRESSIEAGNEVGRGILVDAVEWIIRRESAGTRHSTIKEIPAANQGPVVHGLHETEGGDAEIPHQHNHAEDRDLIGHSHNEH